MAWKNYFLTVSVVCGAVAAHLVINKHTCTGFVGGAVLVIVSAICFHIWSLRPAKNLSLGGILQCYMELQLMSIIGKRSMSSFKTMCENVEKTQAETLLGHLHRDKDTKYGMDHNMADIKTVTDFRSRMRITTYDDYRPYINRTLEGEQNVLFKEDIDYFAATSGTTSGKSKLFPINKSAYTKELFKTFFIVFSNIIGTEPGTSYLKFNQTLSVPSRVQTTDRGVKKGSASAIMWMHKLYSCTPREIMEVYDEDTAFYIHLVFVLREKELGFMFIMTSALLLKILSMVENNWENLVRDLRRGKLDASLDIEEHLRRGFEKRLTPMPERADELSAIFTKGFKHVVPKIWPGLKGISAMTSGSLSIQTQIVRETYVGPDIPFFSTGHGSTEGLLGQMLFEEGLRYPDTGEVRDDYTLLPNIHFYEFIPIDNVNEDQPKTLLAHQVEKGQAYELVVTNSRGLCRYRTGDVIRISSYFGNTPQYKLLQRVGDVLNLSTEKVPETVFREAMTEAAKEWTSSQLVNYVVTENVHVDRITGNSNSKLCYVVFVETKSDNALPTNTTSTLDAHLRRLSDTYEAFRVKGTIDEPRIVHVTKGTFELVRDLAAEENPMMSRMQYKHPRIVRSEDKLKLLLKNEVETSESTAS